MKPRHSFWGVLGPTEAPKFGTGSRASRGGVDPAVSAESDAQAKVAELVTILGEVVIFGHVIAVVARHEVDIVLVEAVALLGEVLDLVSVVGIELERRADMRLVRHGLQFLPALV
jgi:hypothetical protein